MQLDITPYDQKDIPSESAIPLPDPHFYDAVGGKDGFTKMVSDFYDKIVESDISFFFPQEDEEIEKLKVHNGKYFAQISGGPDLYSQEMGHVDMIKMHKPFSINEKHRIEWLGVWREVLFEDAKDVDSKLVKSYWNFLDSYSKLLINRPKSIKSLHDIPEK